MYSPTRFYFSVFLLLLAFSLIAQDSTNLEKLLPTHEVLGDFKLKQDVEAYDSEDLFFLINGGADLFLEYGFNSMVKADYRNENHNLLVEIYEMNDPPAAFGMYSMMQMRDDKPDSIGDAGQILNDHALFAKGKYLVKINADLPEDQAEALLKRMSDNIASKIVVQRFNPVLSLQLLPVTNYDLPELKYFRGPLGLNNIYPLSSKNIYDFKEGVAGIYQGFKVIVFNCQNSKKALLQFGMIADMVSTTLKYTDFNLTGKEFTALDNLGHRIYTNLYENYVYLIIHSKQMNITPLKKEIRINIDLITM